MIKIRDLSKIYKNKTHALKQVSLDIGTGMFGLIGQNGAGKTTLMRILAGLLTPTEGEIISFGHDMRTRKGKQAVKMILGYLPQEFGLYPTLTGREFLDYMGILKGINNKSDRKQQVTMLLETMRLNDKADERLKTYSGGMKRRIGIAQALLGHPKLLIVDEPTVGLDPEERVRFRNLLSDIAQRCTVILSTHIIEDISQSCNDLAVLNEGNVLFRGSPLELISQAQGKVWTITATQGERPPEYLSIVSTLQMQDGIQYRVLGTVPADLDAIPTEPSLEDGYIWMMHQTQTLTQITAP